MSHHLCCSACRWGLHTATKACEDRNDVCMAKGGACWEEMKLKLRNDGAYR